MAARVPRACPARPAARTREVKHGFRFRPLIALRSRLEEGEPVLCGHRGHGVWRDAASGEEAGSWGISAWLLARQETSSGRRVKMSTVLVLIFVPFENDWDGVSVL